MKEIDAKVAELITPTLEALGFELVRVTYGGGNRKPTLQIMAERSDGTMGVDDCAIVSRELSALLDAEDPIRGEYVLEVSSPGIDRPLTRPKDFARWQGHVAKVEMQDLVSERKRFRGVIIVSDSDQVTIETDDLGPVSLPFKDISKAKLVLTDALIAATQQSQKERI